MALKRREENIPTLNHLGSSFERVVKKILVLAVPQAQALFTSKDVHRPSLGAAISGLAEGSPEHPISPGLRGLARHWSGGDPPAAIFLPRS